MEGSGGEGRVSDKMGSVDNLGPTKRVHLILRIRPQLKLCHELGGGGCIVSVVNVALQQGSTRNGNGDAERWCETWQSDVARFVMETLEQLIVIIA